MLQRLAHLQQYLDGKGPSVLHPGKRNDVVHARGAAWGRLYWILLCCMLGKRNDVMYAFSSKERRLINVALKNYMVIMS
jgi:hypothetical protein